MRGLRFRRRRRRRRIHFEIRMLRPVALWAGKIAIVCLFAFVFVWYFGQRVAVVGDSMSPILSNGDVTLVNRIVYDATAPKRGDIIVFQPKGNENSHYYIKRIIGLPGETVQILEGDIYIDGEKLEEDYEVSEISDPGTAVEEITLAGDEFFVLGDDRENSEDSRMPDVGNVRRSYIYGKAWFVVSPWEHFGFVHS
ncbi:signal peptidase I [Mordavella massiliensis]|uniref:Signal peptidase I n=1 Tax=Mordavella massiliensis TaxID=1871024 RepID=A0A938XCG7_9CLOT|nr:signal peptidase I [Mordavella massiliensis]MBM6949485.1 signal peptidase I [Mordavella massiliensis]